MKPELSFKEADIPFSPLNCTTAYGSLSVDSVATDITLGTSILALCSSLFVLLGIFCNGHFRAEFPLRIVGYMAVTDGLIAINLLLNSIFCLTMDVVLVDLHNHSSISSKASFVVYPFGYAANFSNWMLNAVLSFCLFEASRGVSMARRERMILLLTCISSLAFAGTMAALTFCLEAVTFLYVRAFVFMLCIFGTYIFCAFNYGRAIANLRKLSNVLSTTRRRKAKNGDNGPLLEKERTVTQKKLSAKVKHLAMFLLPYCLCAFPTAVAIAWSVSVASPVTWVRDNPGLRTFSIFADLFYSMLGCFTLLLLGQKLLSFYCGCCCTRNVSKDEGTRGSVEDHAMQPGSKGYQVSMESPKLTKKLQLSP